MIDFTVLDSPADGQDKIESTLDFSVLEEEERAARMQAAATKTAGINPEEAARIHKLSEQSRYPYARVEIDPAAVQKELDVRAVNYPRIAKESPATAEFLGKPEHKAVTTGEDIDQLEGLEYLWRVLKRGPEAAAEQRTRAELGYKLLQGEDIEAEAKLSAIPQVKDSENWLAEAYVSAFQFGEQMVHPALEHRNEIGAGALGMGGMAALVSGPPMGQRTITVPSAAIAGASMVYTRRMTEEMYRMEAGSAYLEFRDMETLDGRKVDPEIARTAAQIYGTVSSGIEMVGLGAFSSILKKSGGKEAIKSLIKRGLKDPSTVRAVGVILAKHNLAALSEASTEALQELTQAFIGQQAKKADGGHFAREDWGQHINSAVEAGRHAYLGSMLLTSPKLGVQSYVIGRQTRKAEVMQKYADEVAKNAQASKLRERSPDLFEKHSKAAQEEHGGFKNALLSPDAVATYYQERDPDLLTDLGLDEQELQDHVRTQTPIEIPMEKATTYVLGNKDRYAELRNDIKFSAYEATVNEAAEQAPLAEADLKQFDEEQQIKAQAHKEAMSRVGIMADGIQKELGVPRHEAEAYALLIEQRAQASAERDGTRIDDFYARNRIKFEAALQVEDGGFMQTVENLAGDAGGLIESAISELQAGAVNSLPVSILPDVSHAPESVQQEIEARGGGPVRGTVDGGNLFLFADALQSAEQAVETWTHEQFHHGLYHVFQERFGEMAQQEFDGFLDQAFDVLGDDLGGIVESYQLDVNDQRHRRIAVEEFLATTVGKLGNGEILSEAEASALELIYQLIRDFLRERGIVDMNDADIQRVVAEAVRWTQQGQTTQETAYNQELSKESGPLGQIVFKDGQTVIRIFEGANQSTVLHELGHSFWQDIHEMVKSGIAGKDTIKDHAHFFQWMGGQSKQIFKEVEKRERNLKKQFNKTKSEADAKALEEYSSLRAELVRKGGQKYIKKFAKLKTLEAGNAVDQELVVRFHERFARGFEQYLMEGQAPSDELSKVFRKFRKWLIAIYRTVANLNVNMTDGTRRAFDRMLATDAQMEELKILNGAENLFEEEYDFITPEEKEEVDRLYAEAEAAAEKRLARKNNARRKEYEVTAEEWLALDQAQNAASKISKGWESGTGDFHKSFYRGLNREWLVKEYGEDILEQLPVRVPPLISKDGVLPDIAADACGYEDGYQLIDALIGLPSRKEQKQRYIDMLEAEDRRLQDADPLYQSEERAELLDTEIKILGRKVGIGKRVALKVLKEKVREHVDSLPVHQATRYDLTMNSVRKFSRIAHRELKAGNLEAAYEARKKQQFAELEVQERIKARKRVGSIRGRIKRVAKQKKLSFQHREHILDIGRRYGLLPPSFKPKRPEELKPLHELLKNESVVIEQCPVFASWLQNYKKTGDYRKTLTLGELQEVENMVNFLEERGSLEVQEMVTQKNISVATAADYCLRQMGRMKDKAVHAKGSLARKMTEIPRKWMPELTMMEFLFQQADGTNFGPEGEIGPNEKYIVNALAKADSDKKALAAKIKTSLEPHLKQLFDTKRKGPKRFKLEGVPMPKIMHPHGEHAWSIEHVICIALNMGNSGNLNAVMKGYGLTREQVELLVDRLSAEDWKAIQGVWDTIDELFPYIDDVHLKMNNFKLKKVQPEVVSTRHGEFRGGYYPLVFDGRFSDRAAEWQEADDLLNRTEAMFQTPATKSGFVNERTGGGLPPKLSLNVVHQHIEDTIHYATHAPAVRDVDALTRNPEYKQMFEDKFGVEAYRQIRPWLKHIARPESIAKDFSERKFEWFRKLSTIFILGLNALVALKQPSSIFGAINDVGGGNVARGFVDIINGGPKVVAEIDAVSPYMASRAQSMDREIAEQCRKFHPDSLSVRIGGKDITGVDVQNSMFFMIRAMDAATVYPIWQGSYKAGMKKFNGNVDQAVQYADSIVRRSQPSANPMDQAHWQRTGGMKRLFSMFMTFTLKYGNRQRTYFKAWRQGDIKNGQYARHVFLEHILAPVAMQTLISLVAAGDLPEGEDYLYGMLGYWLCGLPVVSGLSGALAYNRSITESPAFEGMELWERTIRKGLSLYRDFDEMDDFEPFLWTLADTTSFMTGVPASKVVRTFMTGLEQWEDGETNNPLNFIIRKPRRD